MTAPAVTARVTPQLMWNGPGLEPRRRTCDDSSVRATPLGFAAWTVRWLLILTLALCVPLMLLSEFRAVVWGRGGGVPRMIVSKSTLLWYVDRSLSQSIVDAATVDAAGGTAAGPPAARTGIPGAAPAPAPRGIYLSPVSRYDRRVWYPSRDGVRIAGPYVYTVSLPLYLVAVPAAICLLVASRPRRYLRRRRGQCLACGYDLRGAASPICPECGVACTPRL